MILKFLKRALAFAGLATATVAAPQAVAATAPSARPALWEVSDQDTTIYLFGTIHLLPPDYSWESPAIHKAVDTSNMLYVETIVDQKNPAKLVAALARLGYSNGLPPLADRVDPAKRPLLEAAIAKSGVQRAWFDVQRAWFRVRPARSCVRSAWYASGEKMLTWSDRWYRAPATCLSSARRCFSTNVK